MNRPFKKLQSNQIEEQNLNGLQKRNLEYQAKQNLIIKLLEKTPLAKKTLMRKTRIPYGTINDIMEKLIRDKKVEVIGCYKCEMPRRLYTIKVKSAK